MVLVVENETEETAVFESDTEETKWLLAVKLKV